MEECDELFIPCDCFGPHIVRLTYFHDRDEEAHSYMTIEGDFQSRSLWRRFCGALAIFVHGEWCSLEVVLDKEKAGKILDFLRAHSGDPKTETTTGSWALGPMEDDE